MVSKICVFFPYALLFFFMDNIGRSTCTTVDEKNCALEVDDLLVSTSVENAQGIVQVNLTLSGCTTSSQSLFIKLSKITEENNIPNDVCAAPMPATESVDTTKLCQCEQRKDDDPTKFRCTFLVNEKDRSDENAKWILWSSGYVNMEVEYITFFTASTEVSHISTTTPSSGENTHERTEVTPSASQSSHESSPSTSFPPKGKATEDGEKMDESEAGISLTMIPFGVSVLAANVVIVIIIVVIVIMRKRGRRPTQHNEEPVLLQRGAHHYEEIMEDVIPTPPRCQKHRRDLPSIVARLQAIQPPARCENSQPDTYLNPTASTPTDPNPADYEPVGAANVNVSTTTSPSMSVSTQSQNLQTQDTGSEDDAYLNPVASTSVGESNNPGNSSRSRKTKNSSLSQPGPGTSKELDDLDDGDDAYLNPVASPSVGESEKVGSSRNRKTKQSSVFKLTPGMAKKTVDHDEVDKSAYPSSAEVQESNKGGSSRSTKTKHSSMYQPGRAKKTVDQDEVDGSPRPPSTVNRESQETAGHKEAARKLNSVTLPMSNKTRRCATMDSTYLRNFSPPTCDANSTLPSDATSTSPCVDNSTSGGPVDKHGYLTAVGVTPRGERAHSFTLD